MAWNPRYGSSGKFDSSPGYQMSSLIESKKRRATGTVVSIYRAEEAGFDPEGGPYVTVCEDHGTICNHSTLALARFHAPRAEWCEECQIESI